MQELLASAELFATPSAATAASAIAVAAVAATAAVGCRAHVLVQAVHTASASAALAATAAGPAAVALTQDAGFLSRLLCCQRQKFWFECSPLAAVVVGTAREHQGPQAMMLGHTLLAAWW
jgi:hypothetical protein